MMRSGLAFIATAILAFLTACGPASGEDQMAAVSQLAPPQIFRMAADASAAQTSYRAEVNEVQKISLEEGQSSVIRKVFQGLYQQSGRYQVSADISFETPDGTTSYQSEIVWIDGTRYVTDPESGEWTVDAHIFPTPLEEIDSPPSPQTLEFGPDETLDGESVFHLTRTMLPDAEGRRQQFDYWIGQRDFLFKRAAWRVEQPGENNDFSRVYRFSDFGVSAEINPPVPPEVLQPVDPEIWQSEPIDAKAVSWENVTLDKPGRALIKGARGADGSCRGVGGSFGLALKEDDPYAGVWSGTIGSDRERCVYLIEYGYHSREDVEKLKRNRQVPMSAETAEPAE